MKDSGRDVMDAIQSFIAEFRRANLQLPTTIVLRDAEWQLLVGALYRHDVGQYRDDMLRAITRGQRVLFNDIEIRSEKWGL